GRSEPKCPPMLIFIDYQRGTHSLQAPEATKPGATVNKLARYGEYLTAPRPGAALERLETRYQAQFPDGFTPHLLFLTESRARAASIRQLVGELKAQKRCSFEVNAATVETAA